LKNAEQALQKIEQKQKELSLKLLALKNQRKEM